ncbi:MAG: cytochrome c biogenesis protein [Coriobacteriia bacterium]|nr:cytochrome c biogenesis protein [Coriobacteriia bacterium]
MQYKATIFDKLALPLLLFGGVLIVFAFVFAFTITPPAQGDAMLAVPAPIGDFFLTNIVLLSQKIFYFHVPVAMVSFGALVFTAIYGILFLKTRNSKYDMRARLSTEISLVFVLMTMVSGLAWTRSDWGVWWSWEPRLTTYFILMLMVFSYFILRTAVSDPERRAVYSSVFGIIVFINAPLCFMITRLIPSSLHPVVFRADSGLPPLMLIPFLVAMLGFVCIAFALYRMRLRTSQSQENIEMLKTRLEELEG